MSTTASSAEENRIRALKSYQILDTLPSESFDSITRLASIICEVPVSLVSLIDENRQWFKSIIGIDITETHRDLAFCTYAIRQEEEGLLEVEDATKDERFKNNPLVTSTPNIRFYAGYTLTDPDGYNLGTLCVIDTKPRTLKKHQREALKLLAKSVVSLIVRQKKIHEIAHFNKLFQRSKDLICTLDSAKNFTNTNPAFKELLGWNAGEILNHPLSDFIHPEDLEIIDQELKGLMDSDLPVSFSPRFKCADGTYKILEWTATPDRADETIFAIARDVTSTRLKEMELQRSEVKLRAFFENSTAFMCTHDLEGKLLTVNKAGAAQLGFKPEQIVGKTLFDMLPKYRHDYLKQYLIDIVEKDKVDGMMYTKHKSGSISTWLYNNVLETDPNGEKYVIGNAVDITERYELEADLRRTKEMLEQTNAVARIGAWEITLKDMQVHWSEITRILHEVPADFNPSLDTAISYFSLNHQPVVAAAFNKASTAGIPYDLELEIITAKNNTLWVRVIGTPEFENGKCKRVYGTFQDVTENYLHRNALKTAKTQAEEANIAKSEFLASMSHEIRTPLNGVIGFTDLVLKTSLNQTQQQYLTIVNESANSLLTIINDILDFSKIEAGKLELDIERSDLYEITSQAADIITFQAQSKGLEMLLNVAPDLPRFAYVDSVRIKQVLVNLLGNAVKFTDKGEVELKVSAENDIEEGYTNFRFEVRDSGIGIPVEKQNKIFAAFSQEDASTTRKYGGTGLGLTISDRLLALMDSKLQLRSKVGFGSTFYFTVKLKAEEGDCNLGNNLDFLKKVLIVDDNENNRLILKQMLLLKQIPVIEAKNGLEALQLLSEGKTYDVILMDYHMPYMDGLETIEKIRTGFGYTPEEQPIVLLHSSSDDERIFSACEKFGVNLRMVKPIKMQELFSKLGRLKDLEVSPILKEVDNTEINTANYRILVVEDNMINKLLAKTVIQRALPNAEVIEADNGLEAVALYDSTKIDLVLMDLQMPEMNGYEATEQIRLLDKKNGMHTPIIALTAGNVKGEREKCLATGMNDFLAKPFVEEDLVEIFTKWLGNEETDFASHLTFKHQAKQHFSIKKVKEYMGDDLETITLVLSLTLTELRKVDIAFKELVNAPQHGNITALGHKLFGTAAGVGLEVLADIAREIEDLENFDQEALVALQVTLNKEIELVTELIKTELGKSNDNS